MTFPFYQLQLITDFSAGEAECTCQRGSMECGSEGALAGKHWRTTFQLCRFVNAK